MFGGDTNICISAELWNMVEGYVQHKYAEGKQHSSRYETSLGSARTEQSRLALKHISAKPHRFHGLAALD